MSDIEEFTSDVILRCEARSKVIKGTLAKPALELVTEKESAENHPVLIKPTLDIALAPAIKEIKSTPLIEKQKSNSPPQSVGNIFPLADHNIQMSASPVRRTRLRQLAQTINGWEDDCTHHNVPTSRFNINKPSSPQRKPQFIPSSPQAKADMNNAVRLVVTPNTYAGLHNSYISNPCLVSASGEASANKIKGARVENVNKDISLSHDSSFDVEETEDAYCSDQDDALKNSDLSDSFTFFNPAIHNDTKPAENQIFVSKTQKIVTQKCILDDSVVHALEAQGYVHSPSTAKLSFQYQHTEQKESPPKQYQLPGPKKLDPPVKRAGSPVRPQPICSRTPSPLKNSPAVVVDNGPRVIDSVRKQFERSGRESTKEKPMSTSATLDAATTRVSVAQKKAMYETINSQPVREIDPTELSVAERMKLFERPKISSYSASASSARQRSVSPTRPVDLKDAATRRAPRPSMIPAQPLKAKLKLFERGIREEDSNLSESDEEITHKKNQIVRSVPTTTKPDLVLHSTPGTPPPPPPMPGFKRRSVSPQRFMPSNQSGHKIDDGSDSSDEDNTLPNLPVTPNSPVSKKEVSFILPKSPKTPKSSIKSKGVSPGKRSISPKANYPGSRDLKRIRVNDPKPGKMYPSLTDIETTETETDTDADNIAMRPDERFEDDEMDSETSIVSGSSLGTYIERQAISNSPLRSDERHRKFRPSEDFNASLCCRQVDECIDEALEGQDYSMETNICESSPVAHSSPLKNTIPSPSPAQILASQNLVHTVSFYRRQQTLKAVASNSITLTPKRVIVPVEEEPSPPEERTFSYEDQVNDIVVKLELEAQVQKRSMAEASKALNICQASMEFSESTENVEFERVLLISTQKHSAIINEIHRLKTEGILGRKAIYSPSKGDFGPSCKGNLKLEDVAVCLKRDFMGQAMKSETVYHFIALVKYRNQLQASSLVCLGQPNNPTSGLSKNLHVGMLHFPNSFTIEKLDPDFTVTVEVFVLETRKEFIPHEAKYHIKTDKAKMTPKKKGESQTRFTRFQQSPAGPNTIRASKFHPVGNFIIDISTLQRRHWEFDEMINTSYLEKRISVEIQCSAEGGVEERGFLTMFQDISGYGDWHRRWCKLSPSELLFWMYPEDEPNKPLGKISLRACVTSRVGPVPRDVCARANTFLLVTTRAPQDTDKDSLVKSCHENYTAVRHLISADTKEERDLWCKQFNRALANLRAWDPHAYSPDDTLF